MPSKIRMLYYKNVVDECFRAFCANREDCFVRDSAGRYVLADFNALKKYFRQAVPSTILKYVRPFDALSPEYTFVIGGCAPADNMLLGYRTKCFPKRLQAAIDAGCPRYALKEKGIVVDLHAFDAAVDGLFVSAFTGGFERILGPGYAGVFALRHRRLDCYSLFKAMKYLYGKPNCVNVWKDSMKSKPQCLTAVNDLIDLYVNNKTAMNGSREFKTAIREVRQYVDECMKGICDGRER